MKISKKLFSVILAVSVFAAMSDIAILSAAADETEYGTGYDGGYTDEYNDNSYYDYTTGYNDGSGDDYNSYFKDGYNTFNESGLTDIEKHTKDEIIDFCKNHYFDLSRTTQYSDMPSVSPYHAGAVSDDDKNQALNALKCIRYIAGISPDVALKSEYEEYAQHASVLLKSLNMLTHHPQRPSDMPEEFYNKGYKGTSESNLGFGYQNIVSSIVCGYMDDGGQSNIASVGHRRWCLNPGMHYTGFGIFEGYSAMYSFDNEYSTNIKYVAWPAQTMPVEFFENSKYSSRQIPWSISLNRNYYVPDSGINVRLSSSDGKVYNFSSSYSADGFYNLDTQGYGMGPCIIFRPGTDISTSAVYNVHVTGLKDINGNTAEINYDVSFFNLNKDDSGGGSGGSGGSGGGGSSGRGSGRNGSGNSGSGGSGYDTRRGSHTRTFTYTYKGSYSPGTWLQSGGKWRFRLSDGDYVMGGWLGINGTWYLFNADSYMETGWAYVGGAWYYLSGNGNMLTGWVNVNGVWYYLSESGSMLTGWINLTGKWYYCHTNGAMASNAWIKTNGKWYYLSGDGAMLSGTVTPDGYRVGWDGAYIG